MTEQCMMEQRMTEQNGHEEREQNLSLIHISEPTRPY